MKITEKPKDEYLNIVKVRGDIVGVFYSYEYWTLLGSRRAITELLFSRYEPEVDIEIISINTDNILILKDE